MSTITLRGLLGFKLHMLSKHSHLPRGVRLTEEAKSSRRFLSSLTQGDSGQANAAHHLPLTQEMECTNSEAPTMTTKVSFLPKIREAQVRSVFPIGFLFVCLFLRFHGKKGFQATESSEKSYIFGADRVNSCLKLHKCF